MIVVYLAHQLSAPTPEGVEQNRRNAAKWVAWLLKEGYSVECSWITYTGELEETPENRKLGLSADCEQVRRADMMVLVGPRISSGMLVEAAVASKIIDLTYLGLELPHAQMVLRKHGREIDLDGMRRRVALQQGVSSGCSHMWERDDEGIECCVHCGATAERKTES